jgi:hypothetical protein
MENKEIKYEILCNTSNRDYYYTYLDKYEVKDLEMATREISNLERKLLENKETKTKIQ